MADSIISGIANSVTSAQSGTTTATSTTNTTLASNFQTFLTLLTTQLKNQNPLDPLDTNQFTQQLVQFAQVEQQLKSNEQLTTLVSLQQTAQSTAALNFVGATVVTDGATAALKSGRAAWGFAVDKPATVTINVKDSKGQLAYTGSYTANAGSNEFVWDGRGNDGSLWPDGNYSISVSAKDANGQVVSVSTEVEGTVDSVDLTKNPPVLSVAGFDFTLDKIKRVIKPSS